MSCYGGLKFSSVKYGGLKFSSVTYGGLKFKQPKYGCLKVFLYNYGGLKMLKCRKCLHTQLEKLKIANIATKFSVQKFENDLKVIRYLLIKIL